MARTPMGGLLGELAGFSANELGAVAMKGAMKEAGHQGRGRRSRLHGQLLSAGQGQAPARQAGIKAGLPKARKPPRINKMCGSGMQAVVMGAQRYPRGRSDSRRRRRHGEHDRRAAPTSNLRKGHKYGTTR